MVGWQVRLALYVLFFIEHARRHLVHFNVVTEHPTVAWVWQQLRNATPDGKQPRYLRDAIYGIDFDVRIGRLGIRGIRTPVGPEGEGGLTQNYTLFEVRVLQRA